MEQGLGSHWERALEPHEPASPSSGVHEHPAADLADSLVSFMIGVDEPLRPMQHCRTSCQPSNARQGWSTCNWHSRSAFQLPPGTPGAWWSGGTSMQITSGCRLTQRPLRQHWIRWTPPTFPTMELRLPGLQPSSELVSTRSAPTTLCPHSTNLQVHQAILGFFASAGYGHCATHPSLCLSLKAAKGHDLECMHALPFRAAASHR